MRYLFDASSLIEVLKRKELELIYGEAIQPLTIYEALNALWKESRLLKKLSFKEALALAEVLDSLREFMKLLRTEGLGIEILRVALDKGMTAYDASYVVLAKKNKLTLVTEDSKLAKKASGIVPVTQLRKLRNPN